MSGPPVPAATTPGNGTPVVAGDVRDVEPGWPADIRVEALRDPCVSETVQDGKCHHVRERPAEIRQRYRPPAASAVMRGEESGAIDPAVLRVSKPDRADLSGDGGAGQLRTGYHCPRAAPVSSVLQLQAEGPSAADTDEYPSFGWGHDGPRQPARRAGRRLGLAASRCARGVPDRRSRWVWGSRARSRCRRGASAPDKGARQQRTERDEPRGLTPHALMTLGLRSWLRQLAEHAVTRIVRLTEQPQGHAPACRHIPGWQPHS